MATWFSATAVLPALQDRFGLDEGGGSWLTGAVQGGFVAGSLTSSALNVPDRFEPRLVIAGSAVGAGVANALLLVSGSAAAALVFRFATGFLLAGVYPVGMKLLATHFQNARGLAIGTLVGALAMGSAFPHLVRATLQVPAEGVVVAASVSAVLAAAVVLPVSQGQARAPAAALDVGYMMRALGDRPLRLAVFGYLGHMWELYALWAWLPSFLLASAAAAGVRLAGSTAALIVFSAIGVAGLLGAIAGGYLADRLGRTAVASGAMALSAFCCLASTTIYGAPVPIVTALLLAWGATVIADSAQFSAAASELAPQPYVGSALTLQTALGFLLTVVSIRAVPEVAQIVGWRYSLAILAVGPALGIVAMLRLRVLPAATRMAQGRR